MPSRFRTFRRRLLIAVAVVTTVTVFVVGLVYAFMKYSVLPLRDAERLGDGAVTTIVTGYFGPVAFGAYLFELKDGGLGLIDAGRDPTARAIRRTLARAGKTTADVRAIFVTHAHADHIGGAQAFRDAQLYVLEPDIRELQRMLASNVQVSAAIHGLHDGQRLDVSGTSVEVFGIDPIVWTV